MLKTVIPTTIRVPLAQIVLFNIGKLPLVSHLLRVIFFVNSYVGILKRESIYVKNKNNYEALC